jgi:hypothetical protein
LFEANTVEDQAQQQHTSGRTQVEEFSSDHDSHSSLGIYRASSPEQALNSAADSRALTPLQAEQDHTLRTSSECPKLEEISRNTRQAEANEIHSTVNHPYRPAADSEAPKPIGPGQAAIFLGSSAAVTHQEISAKIQSDRSSISPAPLLPAPGENQEDTLADEAEVASANDSESTLEYLPSNYSEPDSQRSITPSLGCPSQHPKVTLLPTYRRLTAAAAQEDNYPTLASPQTRNLDCLQSVNVLPQTDQVNSRFDLNINTPVSIASPASRLNTYFLRNLPPEAHSNPSQSMNMRSSNIKIDSSSQPQHRRSQ